MSIVNRYKLKSPQVQAVEFTDASLLYQAANMTGAVSYSFDSITGVATLKLPAADGAETTTLSASIGQIIYTTDGAAQVLDAEQFYKLYELT